MRLADLLESSPPTGEPDAGNLPVRFGGRGKAQFCPYPYLSPGFNLGLEFGHFSSRWRRSFPAAALSTRSKGWLEMAGWQSIGGIAY